MQTWERERKNNDQTCLDKHNHRSLIKNKRKHTSRNPSLLVYKSFSMNIAAYHLQKSIEVSRLLTTKPQSLFTLIHRSHKHTHSRKAIFFFFSFIVVSVFSLSSRHFDWFKSIEHLFRFRNIWKRNCLTVSKRNINHFFPDPIHDYKQTMKGQIFSRYFSFSPSSLSLSRFRSLFSPSHWLFNTFLPFVSCRLYWCKKAVVLSIDFSIQKHREHGRWAYSWTFFRMYRINFARSFLIIHPLKKNNSTYKRILLFLASRRSPFPWWRWWWWQS